jgi:hypothetical protein
MIFDTNYPDDEIKKKVKEEEITVKDFIKDKDNVEFIIFCWLFAIFILVGINIMDIPNQMDLEENSIGIYFLYGMPILFFIYPFFDIFRQWYDRQKSLIA